MPLLASTAKGIGTLSSLAGRQASASGGGGLNASAVQHFSSSNGIQTSMRSIHIPAFGRTTAHHSVPPHSPRPSFATFSGNLAGRALQGARKALTGFLEHVARPGLSHHVPSRSLHTGFNAARPQSIQSRSSIPVRNAINRTFYARGVPSAPRTVFDVGLRTARNFHSSRPMFQHLADNVPIAMRALYEADVDSKQRRANAKASLRKHGKENKASSRSGERLKAEEPIRNADTYSSSYLEDKVDEFFASPAEPTVTTYLRIPLAPTPTSRLPLSTPEATSVPPSLLPGLGEMHYAYSTHSLRVSSIFMRLDAARVWDTGDVKVDAFADPTGLCTILQVEFRGWPASRLRSVIGEAGKDWCEVEEVVQSDQGSGDTSFDTRSSMSPPTINVNPSDSLVLPKLDFSSAFLAGASRSPPTKHGSFPPSPASSCVDLSSPSISPSLSDLDIDADSEMEDISDHMSGLEPPTDVQGRLSPTSSTSSWIGFSSDFLQQSGHIPQ